MIFNRRICSSSVQPWKWRRYRGSNPHTRHLHLSVKDTYQDDESPWQIENDVMPLFERKAPDIMRELIQALDIGTEDAAAILGNLGLESDGFRAHQEYGTTGSSGGIGWAQWTGTRRRHYEDWAASHGLDVRSDEANLGFLIHELTETSERRVLPKLREAQGLRNKTVTFCDVFERPGVKAYNVRLRYAERALKAFGADVPSPSPQVPDLPDPPSDGTVSPDTLLEGIRPKTVVVRDKITSHIEGFPEGFVETTYERKSCRFVPAGAERNISTTEGESEMLFKIADLIFNRLLSPVDGAKSWVGLAVWVLGIVLGFESALATPPPDADFWAQVIRYVMEMFGNEISLGGMTLTAAGLGHKAGKERV